MAHRVVLVCGPLLSGVQASSFGEVRCPLLLYTCVLKGPFQVRTSASPAFHISLPSDRGAAQTFVFDLALSFETCSNLVVTITRSTNGAAHMHQPDSHLFRTPSLLSKPRLACSTKWVGLQIGGHLLPQRRAMKSHGSTLAEARGV